MSSIAAFLRPLYQDLDGVSRMDEVERIARIARELYDADDPNFELLLAFHRLGHWLDKVGNLTRTALVTGIDEAALYRTADAIRHLDAPALAAGSAEGALYRRADALRPLDAPRDDAECAVAAAVIIDAAGVRGLAERLTRARREGLTAEDVAGARPRGGGG